MNNTGEKKKNDKRDLDTFSPHLSRAEITPLFSPEGPNTKRGRVNTDVI